MKINLLLLLCLLSGCASGRVVYMKNNTGDYRVCEVSDEEAAFMGTIVRDMTIGDCVSENRARGYWSVNSQSNPPGAGTAALGAMFQGVGQAMQTKPQMQPNQNTNCTSQVVGNTVFTNCN